MYSLLKAALSLSQVGFLFTWSLLWGNILEATAEKTHQTHDRLMSYRCLPAQDLQSIQNILYGLAYQKDSTVQSDTLYTDSFWISLFWQIFIFFSKRWPYFDFTIISVSFTGDKAPHCWDTCVIMTVSGASCLLPPRCIIHSTPSLSYPKCVLRRSVSYSYTKGAVTNWKVWHNDPIKLTLAGNSFLNMPHLHHVVGDIFNKSTKLMMHGRSCSMC